MSWEVETKKGEILAKALWHNVIIGEHVIPIADFFKLVFYVIGNADIGGPDDPRRVFVDAVRSLDMKEVPGLAEGRVRLKFDGKFFGQPFP